MTSAAEHSNSGDLLRGFAIDRSTVELVDSSIFENHELGWESADSYGLRNTSIDGELLDREL